MHAQHPFNTLVIATPEDDRFHAVTSEENNWIETLWFPFWLPELRLTAYIHLHFCPNAGIYRGSISAWRNDNEVVYMHRFEESLPSLREYGDLTKLSLPIGLSVRCLQPQKTFAVEYQHADCAFAFTFDSFMLPVMIAPDASPGMFHGHMNQAGRASGYFELAGKRSNIQCFTVRDRSWGPRQASTGHRAGNCHATGRDTSFYIYVKPTVTARNHHQRPPPDWRQAGAGTRWPPRDPLGWESGDPDQRHPAGRTRPTGGSPRRMSQPALDPVPSESVRCTQPRQMAFGGRSAVG
jgi:hypothetical protein